MLVADKTISRVGIVDDDPEARTNYVWTVEDADLSPVPESGPLSELKEFVSSLTGRVDAILCDHHLRQRNYAHFNGAELAAMLYRMNVPAVLCTRWEKANFDELRKYRAQLPALVRPDDLNPDVLRESFESVVRELLGEFSTERRPWRTLVHIVEVAEQEPTPVFYVELPSWPGNQVIRLLIEDLPAEMQDVLADDMRMHAKVNIGAEEASDLYFVNWEAS